mmetsp:Transcript_62695/g.179806  ORF Transcript_62695/g.179806 Transcript_62695/m.179806 type:complete len:293 (+) Transcript_62695:63-941(+)
MAGGFAAGDHDHQGALDPRLFVKNLPADIDEDELREVFGLYGKISDVLVNRPTPERIERSAFIHYEDYACRDAAMVVLGDMYKFREEGPPVIVGPVRQPDKGAKGFGRDHKGGCQPPPLPLPPQQSWSNGGSWHGGGDASAPGPASGVNLVVAPPAPPAPPSAQHASGGSWGKPSDGGNRDPMGKLWVGNLPADISDHALKQVFGVYGEITEVNILPSKSRSGQLCAFVNYASKEQADACLTVMHAGYEMRTGDGELKVERPSDRPRTGKIGGYGYPGKDSKGGSKGYYKPY